jgi:hypothetical protein
MPHNLGRRKMETDRKPYSTPTLTEQGSVVEKTKGMLGWAYEPWGFQWEDEIKRPPKTDD